MYIAEIEFALPKGCDTQDCTSAVQGLLAAWIRNGQVNSQGELFARKDGRLRTWLTLPEEDALERRHASRWVKQALENLCEHGIVQRPVTFKGKNIEGAIACACKAPSAYVLFTTFLSRLSPVKCLDCCCPVPLYRLPADENDGYSGLLGWQDDYKACDTLQMGCATGERFAERQISDVKSSLSKRGLEECGLLAKATGRPVYYYLHRGRGRSLKQERARRCPACKGSWLLAEPIPPTFDFRCDRCRLLSNIAFHL